MNEIKEQQLCPRCSVPGGEQHYMNRLSISFADLVDMCPNPKCRWVQLVSGDSGADFQAQLPGGLSAVSSPAGGDRFNQLLSSLCEPSVDSGVDADCSDRSLSSWEPAASDAGSLCSELAGVGLLSSASESGGGGGGGGGWRAASAPVGPGSSAGGSLPADTRSEPDPAVLRRAVRRARLSEPRPQSGLSLRSFDNSEIRRPRTEAEQLLLSVKPTTKWRRSTQRAANKLKRAERLEKEAAAAAKRAEKSTAATRTTGAASCTATSSSATSAPGTSAAAAATAKRAGKSTAAAAATPTGSRPASTASSTATTPPGPAAVPGSRPRALPRLPPLRHTKPRAASLSEVAARVNGALAAPELMSRLCSTFNTDQVYIRARKVERVRSWARKKTGAAGQ